MRRALLAGALLGAIVGLVFVHHDVLRLSVAWPIILGIALWETVGARGSRGVVAGAAAVLGAAAGWLAFAIPSEFMPVTDLSVGIVSGVLVGVLVVVGLLAGDRLPLAGMLIGFGAFFGVFEPLWRVSPCCRAGAAWKRLATARWLQLVTNHRSLYSPLWSRARMRAGPRPR